LIRTLAFAISFYIKTRSSCISRGFFTSCGRGGTGRRAALRSLWEIIPWKFESSRPHQLSENIPNNMFIYNDIYKLMCDDSIYI
jgi:hypothetical protein